MTQTTTYVALQPLHEAELAQHLEAQASALTAKTENGITGDVVITQPQCLYKNEDTYGSQHQ